jgi:hypothetical protein
MIFSVYKYDNQVFALDWTCDPDKVQLFGVPEELYGWECDVLVSF